MANIPTPPETTSKTAIPSEKFENDSVVGEIGGRGPQVTELTLNRNGMATLAVGGMGLSMLIFPKGVLLGRAMADKHGYEVDADRELVALGSANIAAGLFSGFTVGGSQTLTLLNSATGGRTQVANLASAVFLAITVVFAAHWLTHLPKVAITAILVYIVFGLIDVAWLRRMWAQHRQTGCIALVTVTTVVVIGVLPDILPGTALSIAILLSELARPQDALSPF